MLNRMRWESGLFVAAAVFALTAAGSSVSADSAGIDWNNTDSVQLLVSRVTDITGTDVSFTGSAGGYDVTNDEGVIARYSFAYDNDWVYARIDKGNAGTDGSYWSGGTAVIGNVDFLKLLADEPLDTPVSGALVMANYAQQVSNGWVVGGSDPDVFGNMFSNETVESLRDSNGGIFVREDGMLALNISDPDTFIFAISRDILGDISNLSFMNAGTFGQEVIVSFGTGMLEGPAVGTPEPATMLMFGIGFSGLALVNARRRKTNR